MRKALVVGINNYPSCPLNGCINDAVEVQALLARNGDGSKNFDAKLLTDVMTKNQLTDEIKELFSQDDDVALLYFSGHGDIDEFGGYIVTPDYDKYNQGVPMERILQIANESNCKNKIILLDCCFSGEMGKVEAVSSKYDIVGNGVTIMTASRQNESSMEIGGHGLFTVLLCEALKGGAANIQGDISPASIYAYIDRALGAWEQRPIFKTNTQSFVPIRRVKTKVTREDLTILTKCFKTSDDIMDLDPSYECTNVPDAKMELREPYAEKEHVEIFKRLQLLESVGIVEPLNENHMYYAAMHSTGCKLTELGKYYRKLIEEERI